jgi:hypothetical protein
MEFKFVIVDVPDNTLIKGVGIFTDDGKRIGQVICRLRESDSVTWLPMNAEDERTPQYLASLQPN